MASKHLYLYGKDLPWSYWSIVVGEARNQEAKLGLFLSPRKPFHCLPRFVSVIVD